MKSQGALIFLINLFGPPTMAICELHRICYQAELFFKKIK